MQAIVATGLFLLAAVYLVTVAIGRLAPRPNSNASDCHRCPAARQCAAGVAGSRRIGDPQSNRDSAPDS
jgi:hypothetical protein